MKKPKKKRSLNSSWERPFLFVKYLDGNGLFDQNEGIRIYVIKGKDEQLCNCPKKDLQLYHSAPWRGMTKGHNQKY